MVQVEAAVAARGSLVGHDSQVVQLLAACYLLLATCRLLLAVCCLLLAACYLLLATCCLLLATCCLLLAACCLLLAACCLLLAACCLLLAACCLLLTTYHLLATSARSTPSPGACTSSLQRGELATDEVSRRLPGRSASTDGKAWVEARGASRGCKPWVHGAAGRLIRGGRAVLRL